MGYSLLIFNINNTSIKDKSRILFFIVTYYLFSILCRRTTITCIRPFILWIVFYNCP